MDLRETLNEKQPVVAAVAGGVLLLLLGLGLLRCGGGGGGAAGAERYMFDLNANKLVAMPASTVAPAPGPDGGTVAYDEGPGGALVDAMVVACDGCDDVAPGQDAAAVAAAGGQIVYLSRYATNEREAVMRMNAGETLDDAEMTRAFAAMPLIAPPDARAWLPEAAPAAMEQMGRVAAVCPGGTFEVCRP